jgi:hypothetical protein
MTWPEAAVKIAEAVAFAATVYCFFKALNGGFEKDE